MIDSLICGKWRIRRLLGKGGMGAVFEAADPAGEPVALKILHARLRGSVQSRARLLREAHIAKRIHHSDVVAVSEVGETERGDVFLVMELLYGQTLEQRSKSHEFAIERVLWIVDRVLGVLTLAHENGVVHRDIKPANVFLTCAGGIKVLDFGIASMADRGTPFESADLTAPEAVLGTPAFMAPEQARGRWREVDARTDVWAVGALMFTLLTGRYVHDSGTPNERWIASATAPAKPIASVRSDLPTPLADLVDRALAFEKTQRWQSAALMQRAIRSLTDGAVPAFQASERQGVVEPISDTLVGTSEQPRRARVRWPRRWMHRAGRGALRGCPSRVQRV